MANTYYPSDAITLVSQFVHGVPLAAVQANVCDIVNSIIWRYYPWSWSVANLTPINLSNQIQDYIYTGGYASITNSAGIVLTYPIVVTPNGASTSGSIATIVLQYPRYSGGVTTDPAAVGNSVTITGVGVPSYNGTFTITALPTASSFSYNVGGGLGLSGAPGTFNILRPLRAQVCRTDITPNEWRELGFLQNLSPDLSMLGGLETIGSVGWYASSNMFRLARAASVAPTQSLQLQGIYQMVPTKIVNGNMSSTLLPFPDEYFDVFVEGVKWKCYQLADDPRAGGVEVTKNGSSMKQYTGQLGRFFDALYEMARTEDLGAGDQFMWPEAPLGAGRSYWPGLYGF